MRRRRNAPISKRDKAALRRILKSHKGKGNRRNPSWREDGTYSMALGGPAKRLLAKIRRGGVLTPYELDLYAGPYDFTERDAIRKALKASKGRGRKTRRNPYRYRDDLVPRSKSGRAAYRKRLKGMSSGKRRAMILALANPRGHRGGRRKSRRLDKRRRLTKKEYDRKYSLSSHGKRYGQPSARARRRGRQLKGMANPRGHRGGRRKNRNRPKKWFASYNRWQRKANPKRAKGRKSRRHGKVYVASSKRGKQHFQAIGPWKIARRHARKFGKKHGWAPRFRTYNRDDQRSFDRRGRWRKPPF